MKIQILDHRVMQLIYRPSKALLDFETSENQDGKERLPINCKIVFPDEKDDKEFFVYFKVESNKIANTDQSVGNDGVFHLDFLVRCKSELLEVENKDLESLKCSAIEVTFPLLAGWVNNFFLTSGYDGFYISKQNLI